MTENLTDFKSRVIEYLAGLSALESAAIVAAYPDKQRVFPLNNPIITVEAAGVEVASAGFGGYLGGDAPTYGAFALVTFRFGIYAAKSEECGNLYERLCNALLDSEWLGIQKIECSRCEFDAKTAAYLLPANGTLKAAWVIPKQAQRLFREIDLKDVKI